MDTPRVGGPMLRSRFGQPPLDITTKTEPLAVPRGRACSGLRGRSVARPTRLVGYSARSRPGGGSGARAAVVRRIQLATHGLASRSVRAAPSGARRRAAVAVARARPAAAEARQDGAGALARRRQRGGPRALAGARVVRRAAGLRTCGVHVHALGGWRGQQDDEESNCRKHLGERPMVNAATRLTDIPRRAG